MITALMEQRFTPEWQDRAGAIAAYEAHNARVRGRGARRPAGRVASGRWLGARCVRALGLESRRSPFPI